jgi:hypothetical protein
MSLAVDTLLRVASRKCWSCGRVAHMTPIEGSATVEGGFRQQVTGCFRCDGCSAPSIAIASRVAKDKDPLTWLAGARQPKWLPAIPTKLPERTFRDVPGAIAEVASEAYRCLEWAHAPRLAALGARSVIEATAKGQGITDGSLLAKIDTMAKQGLIRPNVRDSAHEVRLFGNDMAHGDFGRAVTDEDANLVLTLMAEVLQEVYQAPARLARAKAAREARKRQEQQLAASVQGTAFAEALQSYLKAQGMKTIVIPPPSGSQGPSGKPTL